jgi:putative ABC transport system permease protein
MNLFQLVTKQMRQRALSSCLTLLSVMLGVGLAVSIMLFQREGPKLFGQSDFGYDLIIGKQGPKLQLVLNTAYHMSESAGTIPYSFYEQLPRNLPRQFWGAVKWKVPYAVGDNYKGRRIVGTLTKLFGIDEDGQPIEADKIPEYRKDRRFELSEGHVFHPRKFEAIIGSEIAEQGELKIGSKFKAEHGLAQSKTDKDEHDEQWTVVGVLKPTHTANDRVIFIPLLSFYAIGEHEKGLEELAKLNTPQTAPNTQPAGHHDHEEPYEMNPDGTFNLKTPKDNWRISAVLVRSRGVLGMGLMWAVNNGNIAMAASPGVEMRTFFDTFLKPSTDLLLWISLLVTIVAAISILVSIYNSVSARKKEIAILRALGATRGRVVLLICCEAGLIGLVGGLLGIVLGHLLGGGVSLYMRSHLGEGMDWLALDRREWIYLVLVTMLSVLAGLVPAFKAYRTPVATNLVAA